MKEMTTFYDASSHLRMLVDSEKNDGVKLNFVDNAETNWWFWVCQ